MDPLRSRGLVCDRAERVHGSGRNLKRLQQWTHIEVKSQRRRASRVSGLAVLPMGARRGS